MEFNESVTKENVARAFAGLCQDGARYQFIAKSAQKEGYEYISQELKMMAKHKMAHASILYQTILENIEKDKERVNIEAGFPFEKQLLNTSLDDSSQIEDNEGKNLFPHFAKIAQDEGFAEIEKTFSLISEVCLTHAQKLKELAEKFDNDLYSSDQPCKWTCSNCGHSEEKRIAWQQCPLCSYPQGYVIIPSEE